MKFIVLKPFYDIERKKLYVAGDEIDTTKNRATEINKKGKILKPKKKGD